jgi:hypothetical protein
MTLGRRLGLLASLAILGLSPPVRAQALPDFAGTWTLASSSNPLTPPRLVITQTAAAVVVDSGDPQVGKMTYLLDGSPNRMVAGSVTTTATIHWDVRTLVVTLDRAVGATHWSERETYMLDDAGALIVVKVQEQKVKAMTAGTARSVYKRN